MRRVRQPRQFGGALHWLVCRMDAQLRQLEQRLARVRERSTLLDVEIAQCRARATTCAASQHRISAVKRTSCRQVVNDEAPRTQHSRSTSEAAPTSAEPVPTSVEPELSPVLAARDSSVESSGSSCASHNARPNQDGVARRCDDAALRVDPSPSGSAAIAHALFLQQQLSGLQDVSGQVANVPTACVETDLSAAAASAAVPATDAASAAGRAGDSSAVEVDWDARAVEALSHGPWKRATDSKRRTYYYNADDKTTVWNLAKELKRRAAAEL